MFVCLFVVIPFILDVRLHLSVYVSTHHPGSHRRKATQEVLIIIIVELVPNQVIGEMVLDGGGPSIPAGVFGVHTLSLLLTSLVAHNRAKEDIPVHIQEKDTSPPTQETHYTIILTRGYSDPRQGGINSFPL